MCSKSLIPLMIIQGRYDLISRPIQAYKLHRAWPDSELVFVPESGHSALEIGTTKALIDATNTFRKLPMDIDKTKIHETIQAIKEFQSNHTLGLDLKMLRDEGRK